MDRTLWLIATLDELLPWIDPESEHYCLNLDYIKHLTIKPRPPTEHLDILITLDPANSNAALGRTPEESEWLLEDEPHRSGYTYWDEDPEYPVSDWRAEVANNDTRQGYWDWVTARKDNEEPR